MKKTLLIALIIFITSSIKAQSLDITDLKCEHLESPLGLDTSYPRFTWQLQSTSSDMLQSAYQVIVGSDSLSVIKDTGDMWKTGKTDSRSILVNYDGAELQPFTKYFWKVNVWDRSGNISASSVASFEMGMIDMANWRGSWISDRHDIAYKPAPYFRKVFNTVKTIKSARAYIAAGGLYELYINGNRIGDHILDPMYTRFDRRNLYVTYDVTPQLKAGKNAIGVLLGNGWYNHQSTAVWNFDRAPWRNRPTFCLDLRITYTDGSVETIVSEKDWKTSSGKIIFNSIYTAEHQDARLDKKGWSEVSFDDSDWNGVMYRPAPSQLIVSQQMQPIRYIEELKPQQVNKLNDTTYVYDLGRTIAGVTELKVRGNSGTIIRLKHGERLYKNGHVDQSNIDIHYRPTDDSDPFQTDIYILSGGEDTFIPKFNYKGFRFIEVTTSAPIQLDANNLKGYPMHSDVTPVGRIHTSNTLINKIWKATNNAYLFNLFGYPTDCPQREKNGWTGDGHLAIEMGLYNFDGITVYEKWLADHRDEQQPNGVLPDIIPTSGWGYGIYNGTDWTSTIAIIPWNIYLFYGDSRLLSDTYENIKRYVDYVDRISPDGLTSWGRGDWVPVKSESSLELTSSVYFYIDAHILAQAAKLFNKTEDYSYYSSLAAKIKNAINNKYLNKDAGIYASGTQTELSVPLHWGIVPDDMKKKVAENLAQKVAESDNHLDVGVLGAKAILNALSENGYADVAYKVAAQDTYPSWGWWIVNGATTLHENWDVEAGKDASYNHIMFGEIGAWLYSGLGGIRPDPVSPGFEHIILRPNFVKDLPEFEAEYKSPHGCIVSAWKSNKNKIVYTVEIPANSTATLYLPENVKENKVITLTSGKHEMNFTWSKK